MYSMQTQSNFNEQTWKLNWYILGQKVLNMSKLKNSFH